jgi:hypothetical protein
VNEGNFIAWVGLKTDENKGLQIGLPPLVFCIKKSSNIPKDIAATVTQNLCKQIFLFNDEL